MRQQQPPDSGQQLRRGIDWVVFIARALASSLEVFLHRRGTFGQRYFGLHTAAAAGIIFVFPLFCAEHDPGPLYLFWLAFLVMCLAARGSSAMRRLRSGFEEHSYYTGYPRLMRASGRIPELQFKGIVEPGLVLVVGLFTSEISPPLGRYLIVASVGLFLSVRVTALEERQRALDLNDSMVEQRRIMERWRSMRRD